MSRTYDDETTADDIQSCDQLTLLCECGHKVGPARALWSQAAQFTPLRKLRDKMVCKRCGRRRPSIVVRGFGGEGGMRELWRYPKA